MGRPVYCSAANTNVRSPLRVSFGGSPTPSGPAVIARAALSIALVLLLGQARPLRITNITENNTGDVALLDGGTPVEWTPIGKDACTAPRAVSGAVTRPGTHQRG